MTYTDAQRLHMVIIAQNHFLLAILIAMVGFCSGCETFKPEVRNSCVIDAVGFQQALIAQDRLDRNHTWNKLLIIRLPAGNHCVNIFRNVEGVYFWHDAKYGSTELRGVTEKQENNPRIIASLISPNISYAEYVNPPK